MVNWVKPAPKQLEDLLRTAAEQLGDQGSEAAFAEMFGVSYSDFTIHGVHMLATFFKDEDFSDPEVQLKLYALGFLLGGLFQRARQE